MPEPAAYPENNPTGGALTPATGFAKRSSLVLKISVLYLLLTLVNVLIFWAATGSSQMQLIKENVVLRNKFLTTEILRKTEPLAGNAVWISDIMSEGGGKSRRIQAAEQLRERLTAGNAEISIRDFEIISSQGDKIFDSSNANAEKFSPVGKETHKKVLAALQFKEQKNQSHYDVLDVMNHTIELFIPLAANGTIDLVLFTKIPVDLIRQEFQALLILGISMVALLTGVQTLFGFVLYRMLLVPVRNLVRGAAQIAKGDLSTQVPLGGRSDELGQLIFIFNGMSASLEGAMGELKMFSAIMHEELAMAERIQQHLLPKQHSSDLIETAFHFSPLEQVSGDFYDIFSMRDGSLGIVLLDVAGHGIPAALVTIMAKIHFAGLAEKYSHPRDLLWHVNNALRKNIETGEYITAFYLTIRPDHTIEYCNAGHHKAVLWRKDKRTIEELDSEGFILGAVEDVAFGDASVQVGAHDRIILFTDGLVETVNPLSEFYGIERLLVQIEKYADLEVNDFNQKIIEDVKSFAAGAAARDDLTLMTIEIKPKTLRATNYPRPSATETAGTSNTARDGLPALVEALELLRRRNLVPAKALFSEILLRDPDNLLAKFYLASTYLYMKKYGEATAVYEALLALDENNPYLNLYLGICYFKTGLREKALAQYKKMSSFQKDPDAYRLPGQFRAGEASDWLADQYFRECLKLIPEEGGALAWEKRTDRA